MPRIAAIDETAAGAPGSGSGFERSVDTKSLAHELSQSKQAKANRAETQAYRDYQRRVIQMAEVADSRLTRELVSNICSTVAKLPFLPDREEIIEGRGQAGKTEWDMQIERTAKQAQDLLGDQAPVMVVAARKLTRVALELRAKDPDGSKGVAWVNDPLPGEMGEQPLAALPEALRGAEDTEGDE